MQAEAAVTGGKSSKRLELVEPQNHLFTLTIALNQGTMEKGDFAFQNHYSTRQTGRADQTCGI